MEPLVHILDGNVFGAQLDESLTFVCVFSSSSRSPGDEVLQLLQSSPPLDVEDLRRQEALLPPEDSESSSLLLYSLTANMDQIVLGQIWSCT